MDPAHLSSLSVFAKLRKATVTFIMSVCLSVRLSFALQWTNSAPTGRIFMKFCLIFFSKIFRENSSLIKFHCNNEDLCKFMAIALNS